MTALAAEELLAILLLHPMIEAKQLVHEALIWLTNLVLLFQQFDRQVQMHLLMNHQVGQDDRARARYPCIAVHQHPPVRRLADGPLLARRGWHVQRTVQGFIYDTVIVIYYILVRSIVLTRAATQVTDI